MIKRNNSFCYFKFLRGGVKNSSKTILEKNILKDEEKLKRWREQKEVKEFLVNLEKAREFINTH